MIRELINGDKASLMGEHHDLKEARHQNLHGLYVITLEEHVVIHRNGHANDSDKHNFTT